jgi:hypothetical protein
LAETSKFDHDFIEEVVYFILVIALAKLGWLKPLIYYIFRC